MGTLIEPPIVLVSDDIELFESIAAAEMHMEYWHSCTPRFP